MGPVDARSGLSRRDPAILLLQQGDGRAVPLHGDAVAWAGLDPPTATLEPGARLRYRNAGRHSGGVLNVRRADASEPPDVVEAVVGPHGPACDRAQTHPVALLAKETGWTTAEQAPVDGMSSCWTYGAPTPTTPSTAATSASTDATSVTSRSSGDSGGS